MIKKKYKIYYTYIDTDINDVIAGEKSQDEIESALELLPDELGVMLGSNDKVVVLEQVYSSKYIIIEITSYRDESDFMRIFEKALKSWLLLAEEIKE